jgi:hypothetical protein
MNTSERIIWFSCEDIMEQAEKTWTHANCGGTIRQDPQKQYYVCNRCHAEGPSVISAADKVEGKPEEVNLCNPNESF